MIYFLSIYGFEFVLCIVHSPRQSRFVEMGTQIISEYLFPECCIGDKGDQFLD